MAIAQVQITRPANTTAYTAGDVIGDASGTAVIRFPGMATQINTEILITSIDLRVDVNAVPSGMTSFRLHLYKDTPPSALADNASWDLPSGDRSVYIGYVDLGSPVDVGSTLFVETDQVNKHLRTGSGHQALYGYLVTNGGFTPAANSEVYTVTIRAIQL